MTPFQAVCTALAATVGTGNIAGVAGGHCNRRSGCYLLDVVFSAAFGMCTNFPEVTLAVHFRERKTRKAIW
ncbi:MAG: alanine:cation symporter family protein [Lachnospiraceae bacterium]